MRNPSLAGILLAGTLLGAACSGPHPSSRPATPTSAPPTAPRPTETVAPTAPITAATTTPATAAATQDWTTYQAGPSRLGVAPTQPALTPLSPAWSATLDGSAVYAQPLFAAGRVIAVTEDDGIYALDPHDGSVLWHVSLGTPLQDAPAQAGCGDIDPLGITSTPVVDPSTGLLYVVGEVSTAGAPPVHDEMDVLDIRTGRVVEAVDADPPLPAGEDPVHLLQREALAIGNGRVYIGYGGQYGDCGTYHGWLVALPLQGRSSRPPALSAFDVTPSSTGGAIWGSGAAPAIGADGSVYVTTGNPNSGGSAPWAEAALQLEPGLGTAPEAVFQDTHATGDLDLSTGTPVLLPDVAGGEVFVTGKTDIGYRLHQSGLGRIETVSGTVCGSDPDGGAAFDAALDDLYVPCRGGGIQQIDLRRNAIGWRAGAVNSTPILAGGELWALAYPSGALQEIDPASGQVLYSTAAGRSVPNFASPSAAHGLLLVPTDTGVVAFSGPGGPPAASQG